MVPRAGFAPARLLQAADFKSAVSAVPPPRQYTGSRCKTRTCDPFRVKEMLSPTELNDQLTASTGGLRRSQTSIGSNVPDLQSGARRMPILTTNPHCMEPRIGVEPISKTYKVYVLPLN